MPTYRSKKLLLIYCALLNTIILTISTFFVGNSIQFTNSQKNPQIIIVTNDTYSAKLNQLERTRLGFAIEPEFEVVPKPWQDILLEAQQTLLKDTINRGSFFNLFFDLNSRPELPEKVTKPKPKKILVYSHPDWVGSECPSSKNDNPEFSCEFIDWQEETNIHGDFDAIFVYRDYAHTEPVKLPSELRDDLDAKEMQQKNNSNHRAPKFIYFTLESPYPPNSFEIPGESPYKDKTRGYLATYWRGSDIYAPYFRYKRLKQSFPRQRDKNYALGRSKMAAIVVSNCHANNNRMDLVKELQKYVQVDVYGDCGTIECRQKDCFNEIKKNYKFYLAFENSNCRDYITEKLKRNAYGNDLLPIVFGAHPSDYKAIAPPNSYIHIEDFESIKKLGEYLHLLDKNDTLYNSYFEWKDEGYFSTSDASEDRMCEICAFLHTDDLANEMVPNLNEIRYKSTRNTKLIPYFNRVDRYDFQRFKWSNEDRRLCLPNKEWYWNK